jgi:peptide/nickel transport system ATP-binding protein
MAAMALITDPELVILDEPTTALDVTTQIEVLRAFRRVVRERAPRPSTSATTSPSSRRWPTTSSCCATARCASWAPPRRSWPRRRTTTRKACWPPHGQGARGRHRQHGRHADAAAGGAPAVGRLRPRDKQGQPQVLILEDINLKLYRGQAIGVIGESGSGKTTLARAIAGLIAPCRGEMLFDGRPMPPTLEQRSKEELRRVQIVFQMADTALNPSQTIERILARPLQFYRGLSGEALQRRIRELLDLVKLPAAVAGRAAACRAARSSASTWRARWPPSPSSSCATRSPRRWTPSSAPPCWT